jgi:ribosomal protein S18 acetylase RimI-like enzyme
MAIRRAAIADADVVGELFDAYRVFYEAPSDRGAAHAFVYERLVRGDSAIFVAEAHDDERSPAVGFVQLYPTFSSVAMRRLWILNDLYVTEHARRGGVGRELMRAAEAFARADDAYGLQLETAHTNARAQALYESEGYARDRVFRVYVKEF